MERISRQTPAEGVRAASRHYPVRVVVQFECLKGQEVIRRGTGETVTMSSGEVLFRSEHIFETGTRVKLSIAWPAKHGSGAGLQLCVSGAVVRSEGLHTAVQIERHEFRTRRIAA